ncbi:DEAD H (Asp-Glu-Ala-Asp His) box helicase 11 [Coemansia sp. S142-1]|nr:DEAD H (Asp-Glu-Ala-Asp His) box helicase 11 [Coemansia sp. S142-1]
MVQMYITKYWRRLKGSNVAYIPNALNKFMQSTTTDSATRVVSVNEYLTLTHVDHINVYKTDRYLRESKLGRKLNMFSDQLGQNYLAVATKLWLALAAPCQVIPGSVVAFFPSYALLDRMYRNWTAAADIAYRIAKRRPVFVESSTSLGDVLEFYSAHINTARLTGALLLSIVGGRLSESINFSDNLGCVVVMVGVPFPSLASPEFAERLVYYEGNGGAQSTTSGVIGGMGPRAKELYESLCSIGRAIRHRND